MVFAGKVVEIRYKVAPLDPTDPRDPMMFHLAVMVPERQWKGPVADTLVVWTPDNEGVCGFPFEDGESYLVFARQRDSTTLTTGLCDLTQPLGRAGRYVRALGKLRRP
jgi:hypothetical protein